MSSHMLEARVDRELFFHDLNRLLSVKRVSDAASLAEIVCGDDQALRMRVHHEYPGLLRAATESETEGIRRRYLQPSI